MQTFTEEQKMLRDSAERFVKEHYDFDARVKRAKGERADELWSMMVELGWPMIPFTEADGGLGGGLAELVGVYEAFGRGLVLEPFFSSVTLGGGFVQRMSNDERRQAIVEGITTGQRQVAAALYEPRRRFDLMGTETVAETDGAGYRLRGQKSLVLGGAQANDLVVLARTSGAVGDAAGRTLFVVSADDPAIKRNGYRLRDDQPASDITFDGVQVDASAVVGDVDGATEVLDAVLSQARVCLSAEALGISAAVTEITKAYLGTRSQFGRPLGSFQVLGHRLTDMFVLTEEVRSLLYKTVAAEGTDALPALARQLKLRANNAGLSVTKTSI
ncbi:MAG: acyl-CoA dehydrogenase, partial [Myxococcota bacterium]